MSAISLQKAKCAQTVGKLTKTIRHRSLFPCGAPQFRQSQKAVFNTL